QAEHGIGGPLVTGVQTCALPISRSCDCARADRQKIRLVKRSNKESWLRLVNNQASENHSVHLLEMTQGELLMPIAKKWSPSLFQIGRASCRERVGILVIGDIRT